jgi:hypothetical protein
MQAWSSRPAVLRNIKLNVGGELQDEESLLGPRIFKCQECQDSDENYGTLNLNFVNSPSTLKSIHDLNMELVFQELRFGNDNYFELNFYESNNRNDGWINILLRVVVKPRSIYNPNCSSCHRRVN